MLKQHLETCVVTAVKNDDSARVLEELWQLLRKGSENPEEDQPVNSSLSLAAKTNCCK
jgi:hypothetical protein